MDNTNLLHLAFSISRRLFAQYKLPHVDFVCLLSRPFLSHIDEVQSSWRQLQRGADGDSKWRLSARSL